jgi:hypothetical protein
MDPHKHFKSEKTQFRMLGLLSHHVFNNTQHPFITLQHLLAFTNSKRSKCQDEKCCIIVGPLECNKLTRITMELVTINLTNIITLLLLEIEQKNL